MTISNYHDLPLVDDGPAAEPPSGMGVHDHLPGVLVLLGGHSVDDATRGIGDAALAV